MMSLRPPNEQLKIPSISVLRDVMNEPLEANDLPEIDEVLAEFATSFWLKAALSSALDRDPVDAASDAEVLAQLLDRRCQEILKQG